MENIVPRNDKKREIHWQAFKESGKWYASGNAYIDSEAHYFSNGELLSAISETQDQLNKDCFFRNEFFFVIDGHEDRPNENYPFIKRLIKAGAN